MNNNMPKINLNKAEALSIRAQEIIRAITKKDGTIRASRPPLPKKVKIGQNEHGYPSYGYENEDNKNAGIAAYIWRHVVFYVSSRSQHQCIPTLDICYLPDEYMGYGNDKVKELDRIIDDIVNCVPVEAWNGVKRWSKVL